MRRLLRWIAANASSVAMLSPVAMQEEGAAVFAGTFSTRRAGLICKAFIAEIIPFEPGVASMECEGNARQIKSGISALINAFGPVRLSGRHRWHCVVERTPNPKANVSAR